MTNLNRTPPRLYSAWSRPRYPRAIGIGALLLAGACTRTASDQVGPDEGSAGTGATIAVAPAGTPAPVLDEGPAPDAAVEGTRDAAAEAGSVAAPKKPPPPPPPHLGGAKPAPFHSPE